MLWRVTVLADAHALGDEGSVRLSRYIRHDVRPGNEHGAVARFLGHDLHTVWDDHGLLAAFVLNCHPQWLGAGTAETAALLERLLLYGGVQQLLKAPAAPVADPVLAMYFRKDNVSLELFTTIATLGTPQDITVQELRIESFFPMHDDTAAIFRGWAAL